VAEAVTTWDPVQIREVERASLRAFIEKHRGYLKGRVLDFGAGKPGTCAQPEPYRDLVEGEYLPMDVGDDYPGGFYDAVIFTQVIQYCRYPLATLDALHRNLRNGGFLVMTYPTNWDEVEGTDLWRFTKRGMEFLLKQAGFEIVHHEQRGNCGGNFCLGYGAVAVRSGCE